MEEPREATILEFFFLKWKKTRFQNILQLNSEILVHPCAPLCVEGFKNHAGDVSRTKTHSSHVREADKVVLVGQR